MTATELRDRTATQAMCQGGAPHRPSAAGSAPLVPAPGATCTAATQAPEE
jgi:hypothetical protein